MAPIAPSIPRPGLGSASFSGRRMALWIAALALAVAAVVVLLPRFEVFADALGDVWHADWRWAIAGVAFEVASFAGYVLLQHRMVSRASLNFSETVAVISRAMGLASASPMRS